MSPEIVFMGTGPFAYPVLEGLARSYPIVGIYTQPDRRMGRGRPISLLEIKKLALERGLPLSQPVSLKSAAEIELLQGLHPDVIVVAAYGKILGRQVLRVPPFGCINIHPSLLPRHRGPSPVTAALLAGDRVTGVSLMLMEEGVDTGPLLAQQAEAILPEDTTSSLTARLARLAARLLEATLPKWFEGQLVPKPQDHSRATYSRIITKEDGRVDWSLPAVELERQVRAFDPWPGTYTQWGGSLLKILAAVALPGKGAGEAGRVVALEAERAGTPVGVQTGEGTLGLLRLQHEGRRPLPPVEYMRGQRGFIGALLS